MASSSAVPDSVSLFDELDTSVVAQRCYYILRATDSVNWNDAHHSPDYLDMVKVKYRTFMIENPKSQSIAKLPFMFTEEFSLELYRYNKLVDRHGNEFEVTAEKFDGSICFTHGWSDIRQFYLDNELRGGWASITYIRPQLFVLILKDRLYRDLMVKHSYPTTRLRLSHSVFGDDLFPGWTGNVHVPYRHESVNFTHSFIVVLSNQDATSGYLTINYGAAARVIIPRDSVYVKLVDELGLEWFCVVEFHEEPYNHIILRGKFKAMITTRNYQAGSHLMFGKPIPGDDKLIFVKKLY